jgi:hypothetical protein
MLAHNPSMTPSRRDTVLMAIAKARNGIDELAHGRVGSFAVARRESKVERHRAGAASVPLTTNRSSLLDGTAPPAGLTVTALARALPPGSGAEQEQRFGLHRD